MTDTTNMAPQKDGQGKAFAASITTFFAVLVTTLTEDHYTELFKAIETLGYPLPVMVAAISALITHVLTWWTKSDLVSIIIGWIKSWKKIVSAWKSPN